MRIIHTINEFRDARATFDSLAFVPTMGNLHAGHLALMQQARDQSPNVAASIFVNRLQFGAGEDFDRYPRTFTEDARQLAAAGVKLLFAPDEGEMYPKPQTYHIDPPAEQVSILEGEFRSGHFRGVATVVMKLLNIVRPSAALFGKKDYQQLMVLRNMAQEFMMPISIIAGETVRAEDGLALSSRNGYLTPDERAEAPSLFATLKRMDETIKGGCSDWRALEMSALADLSQRGWQPDYIRICRRCDLQIAEPGSDEALVILAAARLGSTRLIDNLEI